MSQHFRRFCHLSSVLSSSIVPKEMTPIIKVFPENISNNVSDGVPNKKSRLNSKVDSPSRNRLCSNPNSYAVEEAVKKLKNGGIIGIPTDTIYGVACLAQHVEAVQKMYAIKGRDPSKPVAICVGATLDIPKWSKVTVPRELLNKLLPGPVTVVFERSKILNPNLNPHTNFVGIRVPNSSFICQVVQGCGEPLALTSANISACASSSSVDEFSELWPKLDAVFDGGQLGVYDPERLGSTVVDLSTPGTFKIIRPGCALDQSRDILLTYDIREER